MTVLGGGKALEPGPDPEHVNAVLTLLQSLPGFEYTGLRSVGYDHMGATICDSVLQAGLNYVYVVKPRVERVRRLWPSAVTTSLFVGKIERFGLHDVLKWRHPEKPDRICRLALLLQRSNIETEMQLGAWLSDEERALSLLEVKGVGPKTVDYLRMLVGASTVAVDRHIRTFLSWADVPSMDYYAARDVVCAVADELGVQRAVFDAAVWSYVSKQRRGVTAVRNRRQTSTVRRGNGHSSR